MSYSLKLRGIEALQRFEELTDDIQVKAQQAINKTVDRTRTASERAIMAQINYPPGYLKPGTKRLYVSRYARRGELEAAITARWRPTSLARFATTQDIAKSRRDGLAVVIKRGQRERVPGAFLVRLRAGAADLETKSNLGLAIRLKRGEKLRSPTKRKAVKFGNSGLVLLYGPSVAQAFAGRDVGATGKGVRDEVSPAAAAYLEREFLRLMRL